MYSVDTKLNTVPVRMLRPVSHKAVKNCVPSVSGWGAQGEQP